MASKNLRYLIKDDCSICVNKIKFTRALINLLENALDAVEKEHGRITVMVENSRKASGN